MKKMLQVFFCLLYILVGYSQTNVTFTVKKNPTETKSNNRFITDWKIGPAGDTICNSVELDFTKIQGLYDSVSLLNLKQVFTRSPNVYWYGTTTHNGHAIITFYRKEKNGSFSMVYFRNWVIACRGQRQ